LQLGDLVVSNALYQHDFGTVKPYGFVSQQAPKGIHWEPKDFRVLNRQLIDLALSYEHEGPSSVHQGVIVSGDQFISSDEKKRWLRKKFEADAVDMGAAAIGQVCQANEIPFVALRVITDRADILARTNFGSWIHPYKSSIDLLDLLSHITSGYQKELGT
jgi:nucleoside phosphorylase